MIINCIIVDDEPLARKGLKKYADKLDFLDLKLQCKDALELDKALKSMSIDLVFLDINMPHISGLQYLKSSSISPKVIVTTAYHEYALEAYELDILDYLLKPISFERFLKAVNKALHYFELERNVTTKKHVNYFFLKCDKRLEKIIYDDILFIESMQNYVHIHTTTQKLTAHCTLKSIKEKLSPQKYIQTHKSFIIAIDKINAIEGNQVIIQGQKIPISKYLKNEVMKKIIG